MLEFYLKDLEDCHSKFVMTFTAHTNCHLARQVRLFGPLHEMSQFFLSKRLQYQLKVLH